MEFHHRKHNKAVYRNTAQAMKRNKNTMYKPKPVSKIGMRSGGCGCGCQIKTSSNHTDPMPSNVKPNKPKEPQKVVFEKPKKPKVEYKKNSGKLYF
tara:strand:- start:22197 stop:22484 length:288 start_codon:yes stop_codon:yes gene_type:complete